MKNTITKSVKTAKAKAEAGQVQDIILTYQQVRGGLASLNKDAKWQIMCDGLEMLDKDDKRWTHKINRTPRGRNQ
jgi:hypothetical protein